MDLDSAFFHEERHRTGQVMRRLRDLAMTVLWAVHSTIRVNLRVGPGSAAILAALCGRGKPDKTVDKKERA